MDWNVIANKKQQEIQRELANAVPFQSKYRPEASLSSSASNSGFNMVPLPSLGGGGGGYAMDAPERGPS